MKPGDKVVWFKSRAQGRGYARHEVEFLGMAKKHARILILETGEKKVVPIESLQPK